MRKILTVFAVALVAACSGDATAPADDTLELDGLSTFAFGATQVGEPGHDVLARLQRLPPELALTSAQAAQIRVLVEQFLAATEADRQALADIMRQAHAARQAGADRAAVRAILAQGDGIRTRLAAAETKLRTDVLAVLTAEQRAWLERAPARHPCRTLTDAQRTEISALLAAFEQANAADLALVRSVHERARAAHQAGASRQEIAAILAEARPALERLNAARATLHAAISALLTDEQRRMNCGGVAVRR